MEREIFEKEAAKIGYKPIFVSGKFTDCVDTERGLARAFVDRDPFGKEDARFGVSASGTKITPEEIAGYIRDLKRAQDFIALAKVYMGQA